MRVPRIVVMSIHVDPLIPLSYLVIGVLLCLATLAVYYRRYVAIISRRYWMWLLVTKLLSLLTLTVLLLNPYFLRKQPDTTKFSIAVLIDGTGSMQTRDCRGESRLQTVKDRVLDASAAFQENVMSEFDNARYYLFAGTELRRFEPGLDFNALPGDTDIDVVLDKLVASIADTSTLGAVVLVTDGLDNRGHSLMEGASRYKKLGIPVHCIGFGDTSSKRDVGVRWKSVPIKTIKGKPFTIKAVATRNFKGDFEAQMQFYEGTRLIRKRNVTFDGNTLEIPVNLEHTVFNAGFKTMKIKIAALPDEENTLNNIDFSGTTVTDPDVFRIFYFNANLDWDYKFLKLLVDEEESLRLDAVIRVGEVTHFVRGLDNYAEAVKGFPDASAINQYDCMILDINSLYLLDGSAIENIVNFIEHRGGGVIFTGISEIVQPAVQRLLPLKVFPTEVRQINKAAMEFRPTSVLAPRKLDNLRELANRLNIPRDSLLYIIEPETIKPGALTVAMVKGPSWVTLAAHNYGAGKVAFLNLDDTWKWVMNGENGERYYGLFWGQLISWISSSSKQRITVKPAATRLARGREQAFSVDLLNLEYIPDNSANVIGTIITPSGDEETMKLFPNPKIDGRYMGKFIPREGGEYRMFFKARLRGNEKLASEADYVAVDLSPEFEPRPLAESVLQSLARITGGSYWHYTDVDAIKELPLTQKISYFTEDHKWLEYWLFLISVFLAVLPDWILRRRIGLR